MRSLAVFFLLVSPSLAAPQTFSCAFAGGDQPYDLRGMVSVDQVVVDRDDGFIQLRVARTLGTKAEATWSYRNGVDGYVARVFDAPAAEYLSIVGSDGMSAYSVVYMRVPELSGVSLTVGYTYPAGAGGLSWNCMD